MADRLWAGSDRYGGDVLAHDPHPTRTPSAQVQATIGLVVEDVETGWVGAVTRVQKVGGQHVVYLEDRLGRVKGFRLGAGFWIDGEPVELVVPVGEGQGANTTKRRTASGSTSVVNAPARVAVGSRIWVEGKHDAELIEKVWGDDLRIEGVVVELLGGVDNLAAKAEEFSPEPGRVLGVMVDHLVSGSKESRIVEAVATGKHRDFIRIVGHPYVDVWQVVKPERLGWASWPTIPRGVEWKAGILAALGWVPSPDQTTAQATAEGWQRILASVRDWRDLEPSFSGRVEELIDFVTSAQ